MDPDRRKTSVVRRTLIKMLRVVFGAYENHRRARFVLGGLLVLTTTVTAVLFHDPAFAAGSTFTYTGSEQTYTVPAGVSSVTVTAIGGAGGSGTSDVSGKFASAGGDGASVTATVPVTPNEVLYVEVGGAGGSPTHPPTTQGGCAVGPPAFNGGGGEWEGNCGGGGGGASDVRTCSMTACPNDTPDTRLVVAGGGGGGGGAGSEASNGGNGGNAGDGTVTGAGSGGVGCSSSCVGGVGANGGFGHPRAPPPVPEERERSVRVEPDRADRRVRTAWPEVAVAVMTVAARAVTAGPPAGAEAAGPVRVTGSPGPWTPRWSTRWGRPWSTSCPDRRPADPRYTPSSRWRRARPSPATR